MAPATHLPGKDASLEDTIEKAQALLKSMHLETETASWRNPAPDCWSVHLRSTTCGHLYTNGKGTSRAAALASALGEFLERLSTNFLFSDCFLDEGGYSPSFLFYPDEQWFQPGKRSSIPTRNQHGTEMLNARLRRLYNPEKELAFEHLCDNNSHSAARGICTLPFTDMSTGRKVYFPVSLLNNLYVSNGMAAGNSQSECCAQAISEIIERYVKNIVISKGISLPEVPGTILDNYPKLRRIISRLGEDGLVVRVKDCSLGGKFPVICALLTDTVRGGVYAAFGASYRFETAIERTLTELLQGRDLDGLHHFQPPCHDLTQVADPFNLESHFVDSDGLLAWAMFRDTPDFSFTPWDFQGTTTAEFSKLRAVITDLGTTLYRAEYLHCGMYTCRILAPGISEIYPIDDLIYNNRSAGASLRDDLLRLPGMSLSQLSSFLDRLEILGLHDQQLLSHVIGVLFDEDSAWHSLRIGELKALLFLAMGSREEADHWCTWCLDHAGLPEKRLRLFHLLHTLLAFSLNGLAVDDFSKNLQLLYGVEEIQQGQAIIAGRLVFPGLSFAGSWREVSREHANLLQIYARLNEIKARPAASL